MLKGKTVASLSEAQVPENRRKLGERSRRPNKPPALQAMGDDIASAIRF